MFEQSGGLFFFFFFAPQYSLIVAAAHSRTPHGSRKEMLHITCLVIDIPLLKEEMRGEREIQGVCRTSRLQLGNKKDSLPG